MQAAGDGRAKQSPGGGFRETRLALPNRVGGPFPAIKVGQPGFSNAQPRVGQFSRVNLGQLSRVINSWLVGEEIDEGRRQVGRMLDALGLGPVETPSRVVLAKPVLTLKGYGRAGTDGPVVLLVPAPIKRAYLWDLVPWASVVRRCLSRGARVYLIQWEAPGLAEEEFGLAEYADRLILDCLEAIEVERGARRAFLVGHSLGGTLAAIFAALHSDLVQGLALLGAPLHFAPGAGALGPVVEAAPRADLLTAVLGNVPGSFLDTVCVLAAPATFRWSRWLDRLASLPDSRTLRTHLLVERWALDEQRLARRLFEEVVELLYREDRLMRGSLLVRGQRAAPDQVRAPLLNVVDTSSSIVPPESVLPFHHAARSVDRRLLRYPGDTGVAVQHVGMLVGRRAHRQLWPEILEWIETHG